MNRVLFINIFIIVFAAQTSLLQAQKPNILWIYAEDTSPWMGCYGDKTNAKATPNIDSIAAAGVRFDRAYVPAPVCSATRSALIVGQSAIRFGAHQHRSSRTQETHLFIPQDYKLLPEILIENGYTTFNHGKADYNFIWDMAKTYNYKLKKRTNFSELVHKQPFFGQIQLRGGKNNTDYLKESVRVDPNKVSVPADYPDNEIFRKIVAQHYDAIRVDDKIIGQILQALEQTGLHQNTIVVYFSDHGANNLPRHKQMLTEGGLHVPFMVMGPNKYVPSGKVRNDLVNMLDLSATTLSWAGVDVPNWYEGKNLFSK
ncbi:MAG: sulfatase-like hydrolase/transferase, partial [Flavobacteriaceae bacterium]|nr:sulfatase-like hydrolase/transferase [Flavobacteriaceae bacterium]